jgi:hypothetical protein
VTNSDLGPIRRHHPGCRAGNYPRQPTYRQKTAGQKRDRLGGALPKTRSRPRRSPPTSPQPTLHHQPYVGPDQQSVGQDDRCDCRGNLTGGTRVHLQKTAPEQALPGQGPILFGPAASGAVRPSTALHPPCAPPASRPSALPAESRLDPTVGGRLQTGDHLGVGLVHDADRVPRPLRALRRRHPSG